MDKQTKSTDQFLSDLTDLSVKYGIAINGGVLYEMERDDMPYSYVIDDESNLARK